MQNNDSQCFLNKWYFPFVSFLLFGIVFLLYFVLIQNNIINWLQLNEKLIDYKNYFQFAWFALWFIAMIVTYFLYFIKMIIWLWRFKILDAIVFIISYWLLLVFALDLLFIEKRYTWFAEFLIDWFGKPLLYVSGLFVALWVIWFVSSLFKKD